MSDWFERLRIDGYVLLSGVFSADRMRAAATACERLFADPAAAGSVLASAGGPPYGARNLLRLWPDVLDLARTTPLSDALAHLLGANGGVVRGLFFDKPPGHSWALPWHRDQTIAVRAHGRLGTFQKPTTKAGVPHVEAPPELLRDMVTVRIHLDDATAANGPLRVVPGSHLTDANDPATDRTAVSVTGRAGDVLLMRPLLLHASGHCDADHSRHRRIVHLECAPSPALPDGYEWHDFRAVAVVGGVGCGTMPGLRTREPEASG